MPAEQITPAKKQRKKNTKEISTKQITPAKKRSKKHAKEISTKQITPAKKQSKKNTEEIATATLTKNQQLALAVASMGASGAAALAYNNTKRNLAEKTDTEIDKKNRKREGNTIRNQQQNTRKRGQVPKPAKIQKVDDSDSTDSDEVGTLEVFLKDDPRSVFERYADTTLYNLMRKHPETMYRGCPFQSSVIMMPFGLSFHMPSSTEPLESENCYKITDDGACYYFRHAYARTFYVSNEYTRSLYGFDIKRETVRHAINDVVSGGHVGIVDLKVWYGKGEKTIGHAMTLLFIPDQFGDILGSYVKAYPSPDPPGLSPGFRIIFADPNGVTADYGIGTIPAFKEYPGDPLALLGKIFTYNEKTPKCEQIHMIPINECSGVDRGICRLHFLVIYLLLLAISCLSIRVHINGKKLDLKTNTDGRSTSAMLHDFGSILEHLNLKKNLPMLFTRLTSLHDGSSDGWLDLDF